MKYLRRIGYQLGYDLEQLSNGWNPTGYQIWYGGERVATYRTLDEVTGFFVGVIADQTQQLIKAAK